MAGWGLVAFFLLPGTRGRSLPSTSLPEVLGVEVPGVPASTSRLGRMTGGLARCAVTLGLEEETGTTSPVS